MKKLYFLLFAMCIASISFGQISMSIGAVESDNGNYKMESYGHLKSASSTAAEVVFLRTNTTGNYWGMNGNALALDNTFGAGNWTRMDFETVDVSDLLSSDVKFIFIDGSNTGTCEFVAFIDTYRLDFENWVASGGALFLNAASNECRGTHEMIAGVSLIRGGSSNGYPADNTHQIFNGPKTPALVATYFGSSWSHEYVSGPDISVLMVDANTRPSLAEKDLGRGKVLFGGLTLEFFGNHASWNPEPEVSNLYSNILQYMYDASNVSKCIDNIAQKTDNGKDGAVVTYEQPESWLGATVTQIDTSGLTSGDFFPTGTTTQSYRLVWDGGNLNAVIEKSASGVAPADTCTFTVTVNDMQAPVANCNTIDIVLDSAGYYELSDDDIFMLSRRSTDNATEYEDLIIEVSKYKGFELDTTQSFDCTDVGDFTSLYVSVVDESGNESVCGVLIDVKDTFPVLLDTVDNIEIELAVGICDTAIEYPVLSASRENVVFELVDGLGPDGVFPVGTTTETWKASNNNGFVDTLSFDVIITGANMLPTIDPIADVTADEDAAVLVSLAGISGGMDCVLQDVMVSATGVNAALVSSITVNYVAGDSTATLDIVLEADQSGTDSITVVVEDSEGAEISEIFVLSVAAVNDAPEVLETVADVMIAANDSLTFDISKVLGDVFDDVDDDSLTYTLGVVEGDTLPTWITLSEDDDAFGVMLKPMESDSGCYQLVVTAVDAAGAMAADTFAICIDLAAGDNSIVVGIGDFDADNLEVKMYPNPTRGMVSIEHNAVLNNSVEVAVVNIAGSEVFRRDYGAGETIRVDLSDQVSGMYMVFVQIENERVVKKIILDKE